MRYKFIVLHIWIAIFLISCGIEVNTPVLTPPGKLEPVSAANIFQFSMLETNSEVEFRGFELYYKFYDSSSEGSLLFSNESNLESVDEMSDYGYRRITRYISDKDADKYNDNSYPLIKIEPADRGVPTVIKINFSDLANTFVEWTVGENHRLGIRRGVLEPDDSDYYKSFDDVEPSDEDVMHLDNISGNIIFSIYAFSFGRKDASIPLYSEAVHLSKIEKLF